MTNPHEHDHVDLLALLKIDADTARTAMAAAERADAGLLRDVPDPPLVEASTPDEPRQGRSAPLRGRLRRTLTRLIRRGHEQSGEGPGGGVGPDPLTWGDDDG